MTTGEKIKSFRKKQKITQKQLSEATGLAEITIRQYEANKYVPKIENLRKISSALGVKLSDFLEPGQTIKEYDASDDMWDILSKEDNGSVTRTIQTSVSIGTSSTPPLSIDQQTLLKYFGILNAKGKKEALKRVNELSQISKYVSAKEPPESL